MDMSPYPFSLRQLQYAVAVAQSLSFRQAAERCHVSQPSLSAQLAQLEAALGVQLFERGRRGVLLTEAGRGFIERARIVLRESAELVESVRQAADPFSGRLRIGAIPTIGPYLLPEIAPQLREAFPRLSFVWAEDKTAVLVEKLAAGELDAAIVALEAPIGDVASCVLGKDPFLLAVPRSHRLAGSTQSVKRKALDGEKVLLLDDGHCFREQALSWCERAGVEEAGYRATSLPTLVQMAAGEAGVTLLPEMALSVENRKDTLHVRAFVSPVPFRTVALVWRRNAALYSTLETVGRFLQRKMGSESIS